MNVTTEGLTKDQEEDKDSWGHQGRMEFPVTAVWPVERKKEKTLVSSSKALTGLFPYRPLTLEYIDVAC